MRIICDKCKKEIAMPENGKKIKCASCGSEKATIINEEENITISIDGAKFNFYKNADAL